MHLFRTFLQINGQIFAQLKPMVYICINAIKTNMKNPMTFTKVLESEFKYLVEAIEHGSSDPEVIKKYKEELYRNTGYKYIG